MLGGAGKVRVKTVYVAFVIALSVAFAPFTAHAKIFPVFGSPGDRGEIVLCPDGSLLTGFHGSRGGYGFGQLGIICSEVLPGYALGNRANLPARGGKNFEVIDAYCDRDAGIRVLNIYIYARIVSGVRFSCVKPRDGSPAETEYLTGGDPTLAAQEWTEQSCPDNEYATGVSIRYGRDVNALGLVCGQVPAVAAPAAAPVERVDAGMENDTDRPGSDYDKFHINDNRPDRCQSECLLQKDRCKAWTYVRPGVQHKYAVCYLKSEVPAAKPDKCCVSGVLPSKSAGSAMKDRGVLVTPPASKGAPAPSPKATEAAAPYGSIGDKYLKLGGANGALGAPSGAEADAAHGGRCQNFQQGTICWHPQIGEAFGVWGLIHAKWGEMGGVEYGYPITDELPTPDGRGRFNHFRAMQHPGRPEASVYWSPQTGAHAIYGAIRDAWAQQGWEAGPLGYPTTDEFQDGKYRRVNFERGHIRWSPDSGIEVMQ